MPYHENGCFGIVGFPGQFAQTAVGQFRGNGDLGADGHPEPPGKAAPKTVDAEKFDFSNVDGVRFERPLDNRSKKFAIIKSENLSTSNPPDNDMMQCSWGIYASLSWYKP